MIRIRFWSCMMSLLSVVIVVGVVAVYSDDNSDVVVVGPPLFQEMIEQVQLIHKRMRAT